MAKEKVLRLSADRELGAVTKKLASGMFLTSKGDKIPPFPGVEVGTKLKLVNSRFEIVGGKAKEEVSPADAQKKKDAEYEARIAALEKQLGEKGSKAKVTATTVQEPNAGATPPKAG